LLVEKVEELTLYILELEERLVEVEAAENDENTETDFAQRIADLERLVKELLND
jgi:hypothetical protein